MKLDDEANTAFAQEVVGAASLLPTAIEWFGENLEPGDVFPREKLEEWARAAGWGPAGEVDRLGSEE